MWTSRYFVYSTYDKKNLKIDLHQLALYPRIDKLYIIPAKYISDFALLNGSFIFKKTNPININFITIIRNKKNITIYPYEKNKDNIDEITEMREMISYDFIKNINNLCLKSKKDLYKEYKNYLSNNKNNILEYITYMILPKNDLIYQIMKLKYDL